MKKLIIGLVAALLSTFSLALEINTATAADLDTIKGIGPKMAATILEERKKNGNFKDWSDFAARVKGVGEKNSIKFSQSGLTVAGKSLPGAAPAKGKSGATAAKPASESTKGSTSSTAGAALGTAKPATSAGK